MQRARTPDDDLAELERELLVERLRWYRRANECAERQDFERRIGEVLERKGYVVIPRGRRR